MKEVKIYHLRENWEDLVKGRGKTAYEETRMLSMDKYLEITIYSDRSSDSVVFNVNGLVFWSETDINHFCYTTEEWRQIRLEKLIN